MSSNIFDIISKEDIITEVRLMNSMGDSNKIYLLVEGDSDLIFFNRFFDDGVILRQIPGGKRQLEDILLEDHMTSSNVIAICDRDYGLYHNNSRCFCYDYNSLETMLFSDDNCINSLLDTHYFKTTPKDEFKNKLLDSLEILGILRSINWTDGIGLCFNGLEYWAFMDVNTFEVNETKLLEQIKSRSNQVIANVVEKTLERAKSLNEIMALNKQDLLFLVNGHDLIRCLKLHIETEFKKKYAEDYYTHLLISLFFVPAFCRTSLYGDLKDYFKSNNLESVNAFAF